MPRMTFRFYAELNDFLAPGLRERTVPWFFDQHPPVKHAIEALGVPHTEVELVLVNGEPSGLDRCLGDGDRVSAYPAFRALELPEDVRVRAPLGEPRFVLDCHLGRLAKYLRLLGFDTLYANHAPDEELAAVAARERRVLLTMDRDLLKRSQVEYGCYVREALPRRQLIDLLRRYGLRGMMRPLTRCLRCNTPLEPVEKERVLGRIPPKTRVWCDEFRHCPSCDRLYWKGSHYDRMIRFIEALPC